MHFTTNILVALNRLAFRVTIVYNLNLLNIIRKEIFCGLQVGAGFYSVMHVPLRIIALTSIFLF